jgi:hypothetical protein
MEGEDGEVKPQNPTLLLDFKKIFLGDILL